MFLALLVTGCVTTRDNFSVEDFTYVNNSIGFGAVFSENWEIYTSRDNANVSFKGYFPEGKGENDSPLFLGMTGNQQEFVRCLVEETELDIHDYFQLLYLTIIEEGIAVKEVAFYSEIDTIQWSFEAKTEAGTFKFIETIRKSGDTVVRLGFWCHNLLFDQKIDSFNLETERARFLIEDKWIPFWEDISISEDYSPISGIEISEDIDKEEIDNSFVADPEYLAYRLKGENNTIYVAGSIHVGQPDFFPFTDEIEDAFESSDYLVVEVDLTTEENMNNAANIMEFAQLENGQTLDQVLSEELYLKLSETFADFGMPIENFNSFEPWFISILLPAFKITSLGYLEEFGVDKYFMNKALGNKEILELETFMDQIDLFRDMDSEANLINTILTLPGTETMLKELVKAWKMGDEEKLNMLMHDEYKSEIFDTSDFYAKMFTERNIEMTEKIGKFLDDDKDYFIVVGAGHLVGDDGIISLLEKDGFKAEKLK